MRRQLRKLCIIFVVFCVPQILLLVGLTSFSQKNDQKMDFVASQYDDEQRREGDRAHKDDIMEDNADVIMAPQLHIPQDDIDAAQGEQKNNYLKRKQINVQAINSRIKSIKESKSYKQFEGLIFNSSVHSESDSICFIPKLEVPNICPKSIAWKCNLGPTFSHNNGNRTIHVTCDDFRVNTIDRTLIEQNDVYVAQPAKWMYHKGPAVVEFNTEYMDIACNTKSLRERANHNYHTQFIPKKKVNTEQHKKLKEQLLFEPNWQPISLLVVSLDSLSRAHAHRSCGLPKTMTFLKNLKRENSPFHSFLFNRFNSAGTDNIQNLTPLFSGQNFENKDEFKYKTKKNSLDYVEEWIWQYANKRGYLTSCGNSKCMMMGSKTKWNGCHYRPPAMAHEEHGWMARENEQVSPGVLSGFCEGNHFLHEYILNYTQGFLKQPHSAKWAAIGINAHHSRKAESINQVDEDLRRFLENVLNDNANLVVLLLGDHGKPYSDITHLGGKYESLLPFLSIIMPSWLLEMKPDVHYNLLVNQQRYLTHMDLHLSMKSLMHFPNMEQVSGVVGDNVINVFTQEISRKRSCKEAGISAWSCACGKIKELAKSEWGILHYETVNFVIKFINNKHSKKTLYKVGKRKDWNPLHDTSCMNISLDKILNIQVREEVGADGSTAIYYQLLFQAKQFKTVWLAVVDNKWTIHKLHQKSTYNKFQPCSDNLVEMEFCVCDITKSKN
ncbi:uncharacterized protein [Antedon mediterranea]|uniref:uncharacterized protein n=1 Tax=Antedon mediterranea TaxID=105859 RepID=UPI003AF70BFA